MAMDLRGQSDMQQLEQITGRKYKPLKYWANFDPSDAKLVFDVRMTARLLPKCPTQFDEHNHHYLLADTYLHKSWVPKSVI